MKPDPAAAHGVGPARAGPRAISVEGFRGFRRDEEVLAETRSLFCRLNVSVLDQQPVPLVARAAGEIEADDDGVSCSAV